MKKNKLSIVLSSMFILFLFATFILQYEYLFITRVASIIFGVVYLVIELNKGYFSANKMVFIIFSVVSIIVLMVSISFDIVSESGVTNERVFFAPVYASILIIIMYKDLYSEKK